MSALRPKWRPLITKPWARAFATDRGQQIFALPDGRGLGFAEYGNPDGKPLLYFHGYPSSRLEAEALHNMARLNDIRLLALDRPGFGLSSPQINRQILDWPNDVREFSEGMNLPKFAVLGASGGGPFALACAHTLPSMLTGVVLFASGPPWAAGGHQMSLMRRIMSRMANNCPIVLKTLLQVLVHSLKWLVTTGLVTRRLGKWLDEQDKKQSASKPKTHSQRIEALTKVVIDEPFRQGADAAVYEAKLLSSQDWGFRFEDVKFDQVHIWHGKEDGNAPITMIRYMAQRLPHCTLHELDNETHYTMFKYFEPAISSLFPKDRKVG
ncbi:hypothetical protein NM208_g6144 [Fusarium decemcellulare]|uniref:Uncharacterized protein n=1 Tax=Fusarium decemcellulare TaxID=57161 RepID=A0ACC1SEA6_9HYPO|nr:hypothetical protein NM208_g6144 [Fusarium decemcellulare]